MATPVAESTIPSVVAGTGVVVLLGYDTTFWVIVIAAAVLKLITSDPTIKTKEPKSVGSHIRGILISFLAAILPPFIGTKGVAAWLGVTDANVVILIAVLLVILGEGIVRTLVKVSTYSPEELVKLFKLWEGR